MDILQKDLKSTTQTNNLICHICTNLYTLPYRLVCGHIMCLSCIQKTIQGYLHDDEGHNIAKTQYPCPFVRKNIQFIWILVHIQY